jgi:hypothetical protein
MIREADESGYTLSGLYYLEPLILEYDIKGMSKSFDHWVILA